MVELVNSVEVESVWEAEEDDSVVLLLGRDVAVVCEAEEDDSAVLLLDREVRVPMLVLVVRTVETASLEIVEDV